MDKNLIKLICALLQELNDMYAVYEASRKVNNGIPVVGSSKGMRNIFNALRTIGAVEQVDGEYRFKIVADGYSAVLTATTADVVK